MTDLLADIDAFMAGLSGHDLRVLAFFGPGPIPVPDLAALYDWFEDRGADRGLAIFALATNHAARREIARREAERGPGRGGPRFRGVLPDRRTPLPGHAAPPGVVTDPFPGPAAITPPGLTRERAMTCIHSESGLCPQCQADYDIDPRAWAEFGDHPAGLARWEALQAEMAAEADQPAPRRDKKAEEMPL